MGAPLEQPPKGGTCSGGCAVALVSWGGTNRQGARQGSELRRHSSRGARKPPASCPASGWLSRRAGQRRPRGSWGEPGGGGTTPRRHFRCESARGASRTQRGPRSVECWLVGPSRGGQPRCFLTVGGEEERIPAHSDRGAGQLAKERWREGVSGAIPPVGRSERHGARAPWRVGPWDGQRATTRGAAAGENPSPTIGRWPRA